jgi:hypothetical protein
MSAEDAVAEGQAHQEAEQVAADAPVASKKMDVDQAAEYGDDYVVVSKDDVKDMPAEEKSEEKPKPAKSPAKKRPASGDEDDEDDDEPAAKKRMLWVERVISICPIERITCRRMVGFLCSL